MTTIEAPNLKLLKKSHENKWVAFSRDYKEIVAVADTLKELDVKVGEGDVVVKKVLPSGTEGSPPPSLTVA